MPSAVRLDVTKKIKINGHGIFKFNMHNDLSVYSAPKGETGTDESAQVWTHKN